MEDTTTSASRLDVRIGRVIVIHGTGHKMVTMPYDWVKEEFQIKNLIANRGPVQYSTTGNSE